MNFTKSSKKILSLLMSTVMLLGLLLSIDIMSVSAADTWNGTVATGFAGGDGSAGNPYQISTGAELAYLAQEMKPKGFVGNEDLFDDVYFKLTADIDLGGHSWMPIGYDVSITSNHFCGIFDGDNFSITGLYFDGGTRSSIGLFSELKNAKVKNLRLVTDGNNGGLVGGNSVGALAGRQYGGTISNCSSSGVITGGGQIGGLIGTQYDGAVIEDCYSDCTINGLNIAGGLVGAQEKQSVIRNSHASGTVTVTGDKAGGLIGVQSGASIAENCYATGDTSSTSSQFGSIGGLVGDQSGGLSSNGSGNRISNCYATGNVSGYTSVGGLVGYASAEIDYSTSTYGTCVIENSYATGSVTGTFRWIGGLVGLYGKGMNIQNCYSVGKVIGNNTLIGGFAGYSFGGGTFTECYFDTEKSGRTQGVGTSAATVGVTGLTTAEMTADEALTTMTGLAGAFTKRQNTVSYIYYPELSDFYNSINTVVSDASKTSVEISTGVYIYNITYHLDGGTQAVGAETTYIGGTGYTLPIPTKIGYTFDGWYDNSAFTGSAVIEISATDAGDKEYWAKWKSTTISNGYILTVTAGTGGTVNNASGSYTADTPVSIMATPSTGYSFVGWVTSDGGTFFNASSAVTVFTMPDNDTTVTAIFERISSPNPNPPIPINPTLPYIPSSNTFNSSSDSSNNSSTGSNSPPAVDTTITVTTDDGLSITFTYAYTPTGGIVLTTSAAAILKIANSGDDSATLCIPLPSGKYIEISFDNVTLEAIAKQAGKLGNISIAIEIVDKAKLSRKERNLVGDDLVFEFIIMGVRKGERITDLKGGTMTVTLSRGLTSGENNHDRTIFYRDSSGKVQKSGVGKYHARKNGTNNVVSFTFTEL